MIKAIFIKYKVQIAGMKYKYNSCELTEQMLPQWSTLRQWTEL